MGEQKFYRLKKTVAVLLLALFIIAVTSAAVSAKPANNECKSQYNEYGKAHNDQKDHSVKSAAITTKRAYNEYPCFDEGYLKGYYDQRAHHRYNPNPIPNGCKGHLRDDYIMGYRDGYLYYL